jgi:hypothetical protein
VDTKLKQIPPSALREVQLPLCTFALFYCARAQWQRSIQAGSIRFCRKKRSIFRHALALGSHFIISVESRFYLATWKCRFGLDHPIQVDPLIAVGRGLRVWVGSSRSEPRESPQSSAQPYPTLESVKSRTTDWNNPVSLGQFSRLICSILSGCFGAESVAGLSRIHTQDLGSVV